MPVNLILKVVSNFSLESIELFGFCVAIFACLEHLPPSPQSRGGKKGGFSLFLVLCKFKAASNTLNLLVATSY